MKENKDLILVHRAPEKDAYYPITHKEEFYVVNKNNLAENETPTNSLPLISLIVPESMSDIPSDDLVEFLNAAVDSGLVFADVRAAIYKLIQYGCWVKLEDFISERTLEILNNNIQLAKKTHIYDDHRSIENPYSEIYLLGELATFDRGQIAAIPGIGKKTMEIFDDLIRKNRLHWGFSMDALRDLGALT